MSTHRGTIRLTIVELGIDFAISALYFTFGVVHHLRTGDWLCLLYFLLASTASGLGILTIFHLRQLFRARSIN
jgi:hypothetical protein